VDDENLHVVREGNYRPFRQGALLFDPLQASCSVPASPSDAAAGTLPALRTGDCRSGQRRTVLFDGLLVEGLVPAAEGTAEGRSAVGGSKRMTSACIACGKPDLTGVYSLAGVCPACIGLACTGGVVRGAGRCISCGMHTPLVTNGRRCARCVGLDCIDAAADRFRTGQPDRRCRCVVCGAPFLSWRSTTLYCSLRCREKMRWMRHRQANQTKNPAGAGAQEV
jgi:predicted nucleic acid-binding Zn ribbon protein